MACEIEEHDVEHTPGGLAILAWNVKPLSHPQVNAVGFVCGEFANPEQSKIHC